MIFGWEQREENNNMKRNSSRSDISTLLALLSADAKSAVLLRIRWLTKVEARDFPWLHFPRWLCLVHGQLVSATWKGRSYVNARVSVSSMFNNSQFYFKYYFLRHKNSPRSIELVSIVQYLFSILIHQNTKSTTDLNIYSILKERPKTLLKMFLIDVNRLKLTRRPHDVIFW